MSNKGNVILIVIFSVFFLFGLAIIGSYLNLITIPWLKFDSKINMNRDIITQTYDADNALYNYHWFKSKTEEIKATDNKIIDAKTSLDDFLITFPKEKWDSIDKNEYNRLNTNYLGLKNYYNDLVAEYNARAKSADREIFKDQLPLFFDVK